MEIDDNTGDLLDEEELGEMDDNYFAEIGNTYAVISSYSLKEEPLESSTEIREPELQLLENIRVKQEIIDPDDSSTVTTSTVQKAAPKNVSDKSSNHSTSEKKSDKNKEKPKDPKSKLGRYSISEKEIKKRDSVGVRSDERPKRDDRSHHSRNRRSPPYSRHQPRSRDSSRRSPVNRGNARNTPKKPSFYEDITNQIPALKDQIHNAGLQIQNSFIPPHQQMTPYDMYHGYSQPMCVMYPQPVPAPIIMQQYQQFGQTPIDPNQVSYQNSVMMPFAAAPSSVPNPPNWQTQIAPIISADRNAVSADPRLAKRNTNASPPGTSSSTNIGQEVDNSFKKKLSLSDLLSQQQRNASKNQINDCAKSALARCKGVLELFEDLEKKRYKTQFIHTKSQKPRPYLKLIERQNKSPLTMSKTNPLYRSVTLNRDSLLSFPYTNICYKSSFALAQAIGVDMNELSTRVKRRNDSEKLKTQNMSVSDALFTSSFNRDVGAQTETFKCIECAARDLIMTNDQGTQASRFIPSADKEVQTTKNADGFYFSLETLRGLSLEQRKAIKIFKAAMDIKDDTGIASIQERLQHRGAHNSKWQPAFEQNDDIAVWRGTQGNQVTDFEPNYANPSPPPNNEIKQVPFGDEDFAPERFRQRSRNLPSIASRLGRKVESPPDYSRDSFGNPSSRQNMSPRRSRSSSGSPNIREFSQLRERSFSPARDRNDEFYIAERYQSRSQFPDNSARYYDQHRRSTSSEQHYARRMRQSTSSEHQRVKRERSNDGDDYNGQRRGRY